MAEDYLIIYMNGGTPRNKMPGISWLKKCYQMIDRRYGNSDHFYANGFEEIERNIFNLHPQIEEKPEISDHHSSILVHPDSHRNFQTFHQVNILFNTRT